MADPLTQRGGSSTDEPDPGSKSGFIRKNPKEGSDPTWEGSGPTEPQESPSDSAES
jgi:hypothetical protein